MSVKIRNARPAAAVLCAALLAGCANPNPGGWRNANLVEEVPVEKAFISPPPGGPTPISVLERRYRNGVAQDIVLENTSGAAGQNVIIVRAYGPMGRDAGRGELGTDIPSTRRIRRELREQFPGVHMEMSGLYAQNKYGPFGYATGRSRTGAACVYAWQRIAAEARVFSRQRGAITWRLRVCDRDSSARDLLFLAYGLTINGYFLSQWWNPYGDPPAPDEDIGELGKPMLPEQRVSPTSIAPPKSFGERRRSTAPPATAAAAPSGPPPGTIENLPVPGAAVVPRPENTDLREPQPERTPPAQLRETPAGPTVIVPTPPAAERPGTASPPSPAPSPGAPPAPASPTAPPPPPAAGGDGGGGGGPSLPPPPGGGAAGTDSADASRSVSIRVVGTPRATQ